MTRIARYDADQRFTTSRDSLSDLIDQLSFCTSRAFAADLLHERHGVPLTEAKERGKRLSAHMRIALDFVNQALASRPEVGAVSCYYSVLNFAKCYVLASNLWARLDARMLHGLSYKTYAKDSRKLPTEEITVMSGGIVPTLYELITGLSMPKRAIRMDSIYPFIADVGAEWKIATGSASRLAMLQFMVMPNVNGVPAPVAEIVSSDTPTLTARSLPALIGYRRSNGSTTQFVGRPDPSIADETELVRRSVRRWLLYDVPDEMPLTPISASTLVFPQEIPIVLAFFHLGSIARYNPEFTEKLKDSRFWPVVVAMRWHALKEFALLTWSFLQQRNVRINS